MVEQKTWLIENNFWITRTPAARILHHSLWNIPKFSSLLFSRLGLVANGRLLSISTAVFRPFQSPSPSRRFSFRRGLSRTGGPIRGVAASASVYLMCGLAWAGTGEIRSPAHFETRELKAVAEPGQAVLELCYNYTNRGDLPLIVREFEQTCGCMEGEWDGVPVEPGEQGRITSRFLTRGLRGTVRCFSWQLTE